MNRTFRSLRTRNYRLYITGQTVSVIGTWMQRVAEAWLVLSLTDSGVALGVTVALQFLPMLLFGVWGGVIADRVDKRRLLVITQASAGILAAVLWGLVAGDLITVWMVYVLAFLLGCVNAVDMPTRQAFVIEMVGADDVANAVALNSATFNLGHLVGPAVAGVLIATAGVGPCFGINALTYIPIVLTLRAMRPEELVRSAPAGRQRGQARAGLRYVWSTPTLRSTLLLLTVVGTLGLNFSVMLPLLVRFALDGGPVLYGTLSSVMAVGSLVGALFMATRARPTRPLLLGSAAAFGSLTMLAAVAPTALLVGVVLAFLGLAVMLFLATTNSTLQLESSAAMRGRVMALYALLFLGSTPLGGPLMGWVSQQVGARAGFAICGAVTLLAAFVAWQSDLRHARAAPGTESAPEAGPSGPVRAGEAAAPPLTRAPAAEPAA
jgi:MFS family permease